MLIRRSATGLLATLALVLAAALPGAAPAAAAARAPGAECPPGQTDCSVWHRPDRPGGGGDNGGGNNGGGNGGDRTCTRDGRPIACYDKVLGWYNQSDNCYYKVSQPQPDGVPAGMTNYTRSCVGATDTVNLPNPPAGFDPPDPEQMARDLLANLDRKRPTVHVAPDPENGPGLVGLPVWLWTDPAAFPTAGNPLEAVDSEAGTTVRIEAYVTRIDWNMGNGETVTCTTRGTPYTGGGGRSPDCGYRGYPRSSGNGEFTITATARWTVPWYVNGARGGTLTPEPLSLSDTIEIDELQVVTE